MPENNGKDFDKSEAANPEAENFQGTESLKNAGPNENRNNNPLPSWLKYAFYLTFIAGFSYVIRMVVLRNDFAALKTEYHYKANQEATNEVATPPETGKQTAATQETPEQKQTAGKEIFERTCAVCHGKLGEGLVGPNLTDDYWIHGGRPEDLEKTISDGILSKGMLAFKNQLNNKQIDEVVTFILSLHGTNPPNAKAPQGEKTAGK